MPGPILTRDEGRYIAYEDRVGLLHECKGYGTDKCSRLFWTLCHKDGPAAEIRPQVSGEAVTCRECVDVISKSARRIHTAHVVSSRPAVGRLPCKPDLH